MPTYEYECETCGHQFDAVQKMSDTPLSVCPQCGSAIHRVIAGFGVAFKGNGFYINDSQKANGTTASSTGTSGCSGKSCSGCSGCKG